jgi:nucleoside phosphorylase
MVSTVLFSNFEAILSDSTGKPIAIINQGTSGGHDPDLHVYDIVLGKYTTNIGVAIGL